MPSHLAITHHLTQAEQLSPNNASSTSSIPNAPHTKGFNNPPCSSKPSLILLSTLPSILLAVILAICVGVFCYMGYRYLDVEFLSFTAGDALPQLLQLERMYQGVLKLNPKIFFAFEFYNYGFLYYVLNLLATLPFIITENYSMQIYAPRVLNALFSIANAWLIYHIASMYISRMKALVLVGIFLAMSGFWHQGYVYKPDVFQAFFVLACAYCVLKDNFAYARYYTLAWVALGLGIGVAKFQAVLFIPMLYAYIAMNIGSFGIYGSALRMIKGTLSCVCLWIITNPYLLHPRGFNAWLSMFLGNMHSNATNHGAWTKVTLGEKIHSVIVYYYMEWLVFLTALCICAYLIWAFFTSFTHKRIASTTHTLHLTPPTHPRQHSLIFLPIALGFLISLIYLLLLVNKAWEAYYFSTMALGVLLFIPLACSYSAQTSITHNISNVPLAAGGGGGGIIYTHIYLSLIAHAICLFVAHIIMLTSARGIYAR